MIEEQVERIRAQVGSERVALRALGRRRLGGRGAARAPGGRRPAHVHLRRPRLPAPGRGRAGRRDVPRATSTSRSSHVAGAGAVPGAARGRRGPRGEAHAIIGEEFIDVFEEEARKLGDVRLPRAGDALPRRDRVGRHRRASRRRSRATTTSAGCPADMRMELVEPLRALFKDEVRASARSSACPSGSSGASRSPARASRSAIIGEVTERAPRASLRDGRRDPPGGGAPRRPLPRRSGSRSRVLPAIRSVGVLGDERTYAYPIVIRAVTSDGRDDRRLGAPAVRPARADLEPDHQRVRGVNRVVLDISSKPPATIEWE